MFGDRIREWGIDRTSFSGYNVFNKGKFWRIQMSAQVIGGERVKILTSGGEVDPNTYFVEFVGRGLVGLTCKETGILIKVNDQRIHKIIEEKKMSDNESTAVIDETVQTEDFNQETSSENTTTTKTKSDPEPIDFDGMVRNGYEVWSKSNLSLGDDPKVAAIQVAAHCVIDPEDTPNRGYEIFNSYNGTRGKKGTKGKRYLFNDKTTYEKKIKTLDKKGYTKHQI